MATSGKVAPAVSLDHLDRRLLTLIDREPTASFANLAAGLGTSPRTAARRLARLRDAGVVRVIGRTLPGFGGQLAWLVRVQASPKMLGPLAAAMARKKRSRWVRLSRDRTELMCGLVTSSSVHDEALDQLTEASPARHVHVHELLRVWSGVGDAVVAPSRELDQIDRRLLALLARDGRLETSALAQRLGTDASTVSRRRRRLIDEGVLYFEADIHPSALGGSGDAMLWIRMVPGQLNDLAANLRERPEVRFVAATSGECSLVAHVVLPDSSALITFTDGLTGFGITGIEVVGMGHVLKRAGQS